MLFYTRGVGLLRKKKYTEASKDLVWVTKQVPKFVGGHYQLGLTWLALKENPLAVESLTRAVELRPEAVPMRMTLIVALMAGRLWDQVIQNCDAVVKLDAKNVQARHMKSQDVDDSRQTAGSATGFRANHAHSPGFSRRQDGQRPD